MRRRPLTTQFLLEYYDAALRETEQRRVAAALGVSMDVLRVRMGRHPELRLAKRMADEKRAKSSNLGSYVFKHLSPDARKIWEDIQFWDSNDSSTEKDERILEGKSKRLRQELFIHALVINNYNPSEACRIIHLPMGVYSEWKSDLEFRQLIEEIQWHQKNFIEEALYDLIDQRHPAAVLFASRTINADRGYSEKIQVDHTAATAPGLRMEDLDLDIDTRKKILEAIRKKKSVDEQNDTKLLTNGKVIDVEPIENAA